jgi:hypothetical protein
VGVTAFVVSWALLHVDALEPWQIADTGVYQRYGDAILEGDVPYRDFDLEYPPGALPVFLLPSLAPAARYRDVFEPIALLLGLALVVATVTALSSLGASRARVTAAALVAGLSPLVLGTVVLTRYDLWPAALVAAALAALARDRSRLGLGLLALAATAKLYPLVVVPIALLHVRARRGRREALVALAVALAVAAAVVGPFAGVAPGGLADAFQRQTDRPLQIESLGATVLTSAHGLGAYEATVVTSHGSQNLDGAAPDTLADVTTGVQLALVVAVWVVFAVRSRSGSDAQRLLIASAAAVAATVAFGKVLSPQFLVWLFGLSVLAPGAGGMLVGALGVAAMGLTHAWFPRRYWDLVALDGPTSSLALARNLVLVALVAALVGLTVRGGGSPRMR